MYDVVPHRPLVGGREPDDELVFLTVYREGAREVVRRFSA